MVDRVKKEKKITVNKSVNTFYYNIILNIVYIDVICLLKCFFSFTVVIYGFLTIIGNNHP